MDLLRRSVSAVTLDKKSIISSLTRVVESVLASGEDSGEQELRRLHDPKYAVYLIRKERQNIGYLAIHRGDVVTLQSLYIASEWQRQGIGRCAFDFVAAFCREHGVSFFVCHCVPQNHNARKFYERMGGVVIGEDFGNEESWQDSILYRFTLA